MTCYAWILTETGSIGKRRNSIHRLRRLHRFLTHNGLASQIDSVYQPTTACFLASLFALRGRKLIAVGERLCAKPTGAKQTSNTLKGSDNPPSSTLSGLDHATDLFVGFAQSRSPTAINSHPFRMVRLRLYRAV